MVRMAGRERIRRAFDAVFETPLGTEARVIAMEAALVVVFEEPDVARRSIRFAQTLVDKVRELTQERPDRFARFVVPAAGLHREAVGALDRHPVLGVVDEGH